MILFLSAVCLPAQLRKELQQLESKFQAGNINELADRLPTIKANNEEERAFISYYGALLKKDKAEALALHLRAGERYAKYLYGQKSLLEAAIIYTLDRNYNEAQTILRKINAPQLPQRMYWLAVVAYDQDDFPSAIANAENYLRLSPEGLHAENALHLISNAYIEQKKYHSAVLNLDKITILQNYDRQFYLYRQGYALELNGKHSDALSSYRQSYELDNYSQVAFLVEERLFALRAQRPSLDISFLYPYTPLEIEAADSLSTGTQDSTGGTAQAQVPAIDAGLPLKIVAKPQTGIYLQSGRFSVESNAERLSKSIRDLRVPAVYYEELHQSKKTWVVLAGPFAAKEDSGKARDLLAKNEINSFVVQY